MSCQRWLHDVQAEIEKTKWEPGIHTCEACHGRYRVYPRQINVRMATSLILMRKWTEIKEPEEGWLHTSTICGSKGREESKLRFWGLIELASHRRGWSRILPKGVRYTRGGLALPKYAVVFQNELQHFAGPDLTIRQVEGFDYNEVMNATPWFD